MLIWRSVVSIAFGVFLALGLLAAVDYLHLSPAYAQVTSAEILSDGPSKQTSFNKTEFLESISAILPVIIGFLSIIFIAIILLGGFQWITASGNSDTLFNSRKIISSGFAGLIFVITAYAIASFIISALLEKTS